jgi:hypothetical protein
MNVVRESGNDNAVTANDRTDKRSSWLHIREQ